jgi:hypothetical protein
MLSGHFVELTCPVGEAAGFKEELSRTGAAAFKVIEEEEEETEVVGEVDPDMPIESLIEAYIEKLDTKLNKKRLVRMSKRIAEEATC